MIPMTSYPKAVILDAGALALSGAVVSAGDVVSAGNISAGNLKFTPAADANGAMFIMTRNNLYAIAQGAKLK